MLPTLNLFANNMSFIELFANNTHSLILHIAVKFDP